MTGLDLGSVNPEYKLIKKKKKKGIFFPQLVSVRHLVVTLSNYLSCYAAGVFDF